MMSPVITMLGSLPPIRGISSYCFELSREIAGQCQVQFISYKDNKIYPSFLYPGGDMTDTTFPSLNAPGLRIIPGLVWYNPFTWLQQALKNSGDILHAQWWSLPLFPIYITFCLMFKLRKKPVIMTIHNVLPHESSPIFTMASRVLFSLCNHFIVHTRINKKQLKHHYGIPEKKISVIPHGPLDFFYHQPPCGPVSLKEIQAVKTDLGLPIEKKIMLVFGAVRPYKGLDTALKALAELVSKNPLFQGHLLIAGKMWRDQEIYETFIKEHNLSDHVTLYPDYIPTDQVAHFFAVSDLVLLPYKKFDSQSGVGTLATAFRKPMIVTQTGGLPDLVQNKSMVVQPGDWKGLADRIAHALSDEQILKSMQQDADITAQDISWKKIGDITVNIYQKCLDSG